MASASSRLSSMTSWISAALRRAERTLRTPSDMASRGDERALAVGPGLGSTPLRISSIAMTTSDDERCGRGQCSILADG